MQILLPILRRWAPVAGLIAAALAVAFAPTGAAGAAHSAPAAQAMATYVPHASGYWFPDDRGRGRTADGWRSLQWNFLAHDGGIGAPVAWSNLRSDLAPGGQGVTVAILDTGVAYRSWRDPRSHQFFAKS